MKKITSLLMALMLCLSLDACGDTDTDKTISSDESTPDTATQETVSIENPPHTDELVSSNEITTDSTHQIEVMTTEEMVLAAEELDYNSFAHDIESNIVNAKNTYEGKLFTETGIITDITEDYIVMTNYNIYLPSEEIAKLNNNQYITVVGRLANLSNNFMRRIVDFEDARLVSDTFEITGTIHEKTMVDFVPYLVLMTSSETGTNSQKITIYFDADTINNLNEGDTITVQGKKFKNTNDRWPLPKTELHDPVLIDIAK